MMKKRSLAAVSLLLAIVMLLTGCELGSYNYAASKPSQNIGDGSSVVTKPTDAGDLENPFTVTVVYENQVYIPTVENPLSVLWSDGYSVHEAQVGPDGVARIGSLDGDYRVTLGNVPEGFYYDPNAYTANNNERDVVIQLHQIIPTTGKGLDVDHGKCIEIRNTGVYCIEVRNPEQETYFEYAPNKNGVYTVMSWMDTTANNVNPVATYWGANFAFKYLISTHDSGGPEGSYTKNFVMDVKIADENIASGGGGAARFTFGISATAKDGKYPIKVYIAIVRDGDFDYGYSEAPMMVPKEDLDAIANRVNMNPGGAWHWAETIEYGASGTSALFEGDNFKLNPETGVYHKYDPVRYASTGGWGPVLFAAINKPTRFITNRGGMLIGISQIEDDGNKALTVAQGTLNYKMFIEGWADLNYTNMSFPGQAGAKPPYFCDVLCPCRQSKTCTSVSMGLTEGTCEEGCPNCTIGCRNLPKDAIGTIGYAQVCNSDGCFPVTEELKEFLQLMSVSQLYFMDGQGWIETHPDVSIFATEADQWLWACGYYE